MTARRASLPGDRWHFSHGPIDLVIGADGEQAALQAAHEAAWRRFEQVLPELVSELPLLRTPVGGICRLQGPVARRMWEACLPMPREGLTSMAAVAGAVAQEIVQAYRRPGVTRAWVNNGGDIALHLMPGQSVRIGVHGDVSRLPRVIDAQGADLAGAIEIDAALPVRGVATSGWGGRSFSLGIADSVTVLAATAAQADAAATVIANHVNVDDARILRRPASALKDDSDLGDTLVTVQVPALPPQQVRRALQAGLRRARELQASGLVWQALLLCQGQAVSTDPQAGNVRAPAGAALGMPQVGSVFA